MEGAGAAGQQVGPVVGVQQADVVGAVGLGRGPQRGGLAGTCCIAPPSDTGPPSSAFTRRCQRCSSRLRQGLPGLGSANPSPQLIAEGLHFSLGLPPSRSCLHWVKWRKQREETQETELELHGLPRLPPDPGQPLTTLPRVVPSTGDTFPPIVGTQRRGIHPPCCDHIPCTPQRAHPSTHRPLPKHLVWTGEARWDSPHRVCPSAQLLAQPCPPSSAVPCAGQEAPGCWEPRHRAAPGVPGLPAVYFPFAKSLCNGELKKIHVRKKKKKRVEALPAWICQSLENKHAGSDLSELGEPGGSGGLPPALLLFHVRAGGTRSNCKEGNEVTEPDRAADFPSLGDGQHGAPPSKTSLLRPRTARRTGTLPHRDAEKLQDRGLGPPELRFPSSCLRGASQRWDLESSVQGS